MIHKVPSSKHTIYKITVRDTQSLVLIKGIQIPQCITHLIHWVYLIRCPVGKYPVLVDNQSHVGMLAVVC